MSFANLRKNRKSALAGLQKQVQQSTENESNKDPRKWRFSFDKTTLAGNAVIRFLPFGDGERLPWAEWYKFSFKTPAGNYWNRSLKTIGKDDPVATLNAMQWERNSGNDQDEVKNVNVSSDSLLTFA